MNINLDSIIAIITLLASSIALYFSIRKQDKEGRNLDADTIKNLYETIDKQEKRYKELKLETDSEQEEKYQNLKLESEERYKKLKKDFEDYKETMNYQFAMLVNENARLRAWAHKLVKQLEEAQIIPHKFE